MNLKQAIDSAPEIILQIIDEPAIDKAVNKIRDTGRYNHVVYHLAHRTNVASDMPFFMSTYPFSWLGHYLKNEYINIDPVIIDGFHRHEPFFWNDLPGSSKKVKTFFDDAAKHGIGSKGYSIPLVDKSNRRALFTVTSDLEETDWRYKIADEMDLLAQLGDILHRKAILQLYGSETGQSLSPREIECLTWTARGKDVSVVSSILGISEHTTRDYLKSGRLKLGCMTIAQAIFEATKRRLIDF